VIRYSRVSLQRSSGHVLSSVLESKAAPTPSSRPLGTDRFWLSSVSASPLFQSIEQSISQQPLARPQPFFLAQNNRTPTWPRTRRNNPMADSTKSTKQSEFDRLIGLAYLVLIFCALSWAKDFLLPIALASLISFLLAPAVSRLERWRLPAVLAVLSTVAMAFVVIGAVCATVSVQAVDLVNSLPKYRDNIEAKWASIQKGPPGPVSLAFQNVGELISDLQKANASASDDQQPEPTKVQVVNGSDALLSLVKASMTPIIGPTGEFAVVVVLVVFMLLERQRLRDRFLRLIGHSRLVTTTLAIDEAGSRLSSFLLVQLVVNSGFALVLGIGLYLIGIPNATLWAVLTMVLRFLPYVGVWISAFFALALSIAISATWREPILVVSLYLFLELFTNNVVEPFVLGGSTGISPLAVILSALFWTWLWGPVGLLLATPLTACLVTLGRYFPAFYPWSVLLAAQPPTSSETKLILLLTEGRHSEAKALISELAGMQLSIRTAEEVIVPTIRIIENDLFPGPTATKPKSLIYEQLRQLVQEMTIPSRRDSEEESPRTDGQLSGLVIVPFVGEGDELVGNVLARLLEAEGIGSVLLPWRTLRAEKLHRLRELAPKCVLVSAIEVRSAMAVGKMARSIQVLLQDSVIVVGLWSLPSRGAARLVRRIRESLASNVYTNLEQAVQGIALLIIPARSEVQPETEPE
jgi:predicted PurR-regulated permease PerM